MKAIIAVLAISLQITLTYTQNITIYTTKYDYIDMKEIISNKRILDSYVDCLLDKGPCNAEGKELKKNLPDAIQNGCQKCSEKQRESSDTLIQFLISDRPDDWNNLDHKYNGNDNKTMDVKIYEQALTNITA